MTLIVNLFIGIVTIIVTLGLKLKSLILAYGQTGSGKKYTMFGPQHYINDHHAFIDFGLFQRCCSYLFDELSQNKDITFKVSASFMQIYKDKFIHDLLQSSATGFSQMENAIDDLSSVSINNIEDILINLETAIRNGIIYVHKSGCSPRWDMIIILNVEQKIKNVGIKRCKMIFVCLAGSEDMLAALDANPDSWRMKQASEIQSSLTALTTTIHYLY